MTPRGPRADINRAIDMLNSEIPVTIPSGLDDPLSLEATSALSTISNSRNRTSIPVLQSHDKGIIGIFPSLFLQAKGMRGAPQPYVYVRRKERSSLTRQV